VTVAYDELAAADPAGWAVIDATQPPEQVLAEALAAIVPTRAR
jgi:thymidylate kinase